MTTILLAAFSLLASTLVGLLAWSVKRELATSEARFTTCAEDMRRLEERMRQAELGAARTEAKVESIGGRLDEMVAEMHAQRELLQQILARLPKRASDVPQGGV